MHAKLAPQTPQPLAGIATSGLRRDKGERFEAGSLSAPIFPLLLKCVDGATTLSLYFWILGLGGKLAAGCLRSRPAWIVFFCFHCWVADGKHGGRYGEVRHWVLGGGGYGPSLPLLRYLHLAAH